MPSDSSGATGARPATPDHPAAPALSPATRLVALGRGERRPGAGVNVPVELSSTYHADGDVAYGRAGNPVWSAFEETLASLEGDPGAPPAATALAFSSGMAAIGAALSLRPEDAVVVAPRHAYNGTCVALEDLEAAGRATVRRVDVTDTAAVVAACAGADLLWLESPTNPMLEVADLPAAVAGAHAAGALVVCDNTFATPLLQRPLAAGADVVVHSVTKYLAGHSDVLLGATVTRDPGLAERMHHHRTIAGAVPGPVETWLALRGMRTLHLRLERACANAAELAARLHGHPALTRVRYPGWGAIVAVEVAGGAEAAERVAGATRLWTHATSLGGVESQIERRRRHPAEPASVPEALLRLSVGVEDVEDLWDDLDRALAAAHG